MINIIWFFLISIGIVVGIVTGKGELISSEIVNSTEATVKMMLGLIGVLCLWCGLMKIAEKSGLTDKIAKVLKPILRIIFKEVKEDEKAMGAIVMNLTANMMGLSNAATPFGIKAMVEMDRINKKKDTASNDMALFLVLNACCIQLIPTTVLSIRASLGSQNVAETILPSIIATGVAALAGVLFCKILEKYF